MSMTHYMELLASNQPWNLIIFMAIPVIFAEYIAVTELYILLQRNSTGVLHQTNRVASILAGLYFVGIVVYLMATAVIPLTVNGQWRGIGDVIVVSFYLLGGVPLVGMLLLEFGGIFRAKNDAEKLKIHATFVAIFLVVAHVAMIFGMLDPTLL